MELDPTPAPSNPTPTPSGPPRYQRRSPSPPPPPPQPIVNRAVPALPVRRTLTRFQRRRDFAVTRNIGRTLFNLPVAQVLGAPIRSRRAIHRSEVESSSNLLRVTRAYTSAEQEDFDRLEPAQKIAILFQVHDVDRLREREAERIFRESENENRTRNN